MIELKKSFVAIRWTDPQIDHWSDIGTWSLTGDTIKINFDRNDWTFIYKDENGKKPDFYPVLEMVGFPWQYKKVGRKIFKDRSFVKLFQVSGKAIKIKGQPKLKWNRSSNIYFVLENLTKWDKINLKKSVTIEGTILEGQDEDFTIQNWTIIK